MMEMGCLEHKNVITKDGRMIGTLSGATLDTSTWNVPTIHVEVAKTAVEDFGLQKSLLKGTSISLPTGLVENIGDVVQLNVDMNGLKAQVTVD